MGNYENIVKTEEIRKKIEAGDFLSALNILDTMDIKKVKNVSDINLYAEVYMNNERYDKSAELYLKIYEKYKSRKTIAQMVNISIKRGNIEEAENYLEEYQKNSADDIDGYIFRYKIDKMKGSSYEQLIQSLEALKKIEYIEKWAYELAKVYYKADMEEKCVRECSDIILWFGEGTYVEKAKILRSYFSGDTDKSKIIEEIKRRSEGLKEENTLNRSEEEEPEQTVDISTDVQTQEEYSEEQVQDDIPEEQASDDNSEEDVYSDSDFMKENEMEDLADGLMKDVQDILMNDGQDDEYDNTVDETVTEVQLEDENEDYSDYEADFLSEISSRLNTDPVEIFGDFLMEASIKEQLIDCLGVILRDNTNPVLLMITGSNASEKTALAKDMALFLNKAGKIQSAKIAKITSEKLNKLDIKAKRDVLKGCCLIIEESGKLEQKTINSILDLIKTVNGDIAVVCDDEAKNMDQLLRDCPQLAELLELQIHFPQ